MAYHCGDQTWFVDGSAVWFVRWLDLYSRSVMVEQLHHMKLLSALKGKPASTFALRYSESYFITDFRWKCCPMLAILTRYPTNLERLAPSLSAISRRIYKDASIYCSGVKESNLGLDSTRLSSTSPTLMEPPSLPSVGIVVIKSPMS